MFFQISALKRAKKKETSSLTSELKTAEAATVAARAQIGHAYKAGGGDAAELKAAKDEIALLKAEAALLKSTNSGQVRRNSF